MFTHETLSGTLPPGTSISVDLIPSTAGLVHYIFAMTFGDLVDPNVVITHEHSFMMKRHDDPLIYSLIAQPYPLNLRVTTELPHRCTISNNGGVTRDIEATFWIIEVPIATDKEMKPLFLGYINLFTALAQVSPEQIAKFIIGKVPAPYPPPLE